MKFAKKLLTGLLSLSMLLGTVPAAAEDFLTDAEWAAESDFTQSSDIDEEGFREVSPEVFPENCEQSEDMETAEETDITDWGSPEPEEMPDFEIEEEDAEEIDFLAEGAESFSLEMTYVNPLYRDEYGEEDLLAFRERPSRPVFLEEDEVCTSIEEAGTAMRSGMKLHEEQIVLQYLSPVMPTQQTLSEIAAAALIHTGDPHEGDYIKWQYVGWKGKLSGKKVGTGALLTVTYTVTYYTTLEQEAIVDAAVADLLSSLELEGKGEIDKIKAIYRYICDTVTYDYVHKSDETYKLKHTAYAALIDKTCVCQGYAVLLYRLLLEEGIDNRLIPGWGMSEKHGWNIVEIDGKYYNLDATWDAGKREFTYFLKCMDHFGGHTREDAFLTEEFLQTYPMSGTDFRDADITHGTLTLDSFRYFVKNGAVTVLAYEGDPVTELEIPDQVYGKPVKYLADHALDGCPGLQRISLPEIAGDAKDVFAAQDPEQLTVCASRYSFAQIWADACGASFEVRDAKENFLPQSCISYVLEDGKAVITGYDASAYAYSGALVIPNEIEGYPVKEIRSLAGSGNAAVYMIPDSVSFLAQQAFAGVGRCILIFNGDAPENADAALAESQSTVFYPETGEGWEDAQQNSASDISWKSYTIEEHLWHIWDSAPLNDAEDTYLEPTCTENGYRQRACLGCGEILTEKIAAYGHEEVTDPEKEATCTETGLTEGKHCSVCGEILVMQVEIEAAGHTEVPDAAVQPTCMESGLTAGSHCKVCQEVLLAQEQIPETGHSFDAWKPVITTDLEGYRSRTCAVCETEEREAMPEGWLEYEGGWYFFTASGAMQTGWAEIHEKWYYFAENGVMQTGWQEISGKVYYLRASGAMQTGWSKLDGNWYYFGAGGSMSTGWREIEGSWYYFNEEGQMQKYWQEINGRWYYLGSDGAMRSGWLNLDGRHYYLRASGAMQTGWSKLDGNWYYFSESGKMQTGWQGIEGSWFYFNEEGQMQKYWQEINNRWYYFGSDGAMRSGWLDLDGRRYYLKASGAMQTSWSKLDGSWYYFSESGRMQTGWKEIEGFWYYFNEEGRMQKYWQEINGKWYYFAADGSMCTGEQELNGKIYRFSASGAWLG